MNDKILGALVGAAAGDAMASATDGKSYNEIQNLYGSEIRDFVKPHPDTFSGDRERAQFTDAFSIPCYLICGLIENGGKANTELGCDILRKWGRSEYFRFAGMTTRKAVCALLESQNNDSWGYLGNLGNKLYKGHYYALSSNGSACKAFPVGLLNAGNVEAAIHDAIEITMSSHDDALSLSGASAVAAATAACFCDKASVFSITQAALHGAEEGKHQGDMRGDARDYPGPSTARRLEYAQQIGLKYMDSNEVAVELRDVIGCGPEVAETVPTAFGLLIARKNNPLEALYDAVNIGDETCALATVVGALTGALYGSKVFPSEWNETINEANRIDLDKLAEQLGAL